MEISPEWILGVLAILAGVISTLAGIIYTSLSSRIKDQSKIIDKLQDDVDRLSQGCGVQQCLWKGR
jgi:hypothetical protein